MTTSKWADYCISAVRFNDAHTHIDKVRVYPDEGDKLGQSIEYSRTKVISMINDRKTFVTITEGNNREWNKGQPVFIIVINNTEYIKTVRNDKAVDNLDDLPEF